MDQQRVCSAAVSYRGWPYGESKEPWVDPLPLPVKVKRARKPKPEGLSIDLRALTRRPSRKQRIAMGLE